ncbi:MAG: DNA-packaging protein [Candidatus Sabulitectum sp.]|nr:DNA-packaging protein [Candidatus Sabulitectum sp.]
MSAEKLTKGESKVIANYDGTVKGTHIATGLSYGYCRKVLSFDYIKEAIKELEKLDPPEEEKKTDKRIGNRFWEARSSHGRKPIFLNADKLWEACLEYFKWVDDNPLHESKPFAYQGTVVLKEVPKMRAMTIGGLCLFLDISEDTWANYRKREGFLGVTADIERAIKNQKFTGAAADLLNANIIARDLGLVDKTDTTISNPEGRTFNMHFIRSPDKKGS